MANKYTSIKDFLTQNLDKYKTLDGLFNACSKKLNVKKESAKRQYYLYKLNSPIVKSKSTRSKKTIKTSNKKKILRSAIDAEQLKKSFDLVHIVKEYLESNIFETNVIWDTNFKRELGINSINWAKVSNKPLFDKYKISVKGKILWGRPEVLHEIKKTMDID